MNEKIVNNDWQKVEPINEEITCSSTDCERDLHAFRRKRTPKDRSYRLGVCRTCGADLINWNRIDKHNLEDVGYTFKALKYEMVRHHYWHIPIDEKVKIKASKKGLKEIKKWTRKQLNKKIRPPSAEIFRDGTQTPKDGNIVFWAQYATATCCRKCIEEWHGIYRDCPLTDDEVEYFLELIMLYISEKLDM